MSAKTEEFTKIHQQAVIGHALQDSEFVRQLDAIEVNKDWFATTSAVLVELWSIFGKFRDKYKRPPTLLEFEAFVSTHGSDNTASLAKAASECVGIANKVGMDIIQSKLTNWAKSRLIVSQAIELSTAFNAGQYQIAYELWEQGANKLQKLDSTLGLTPDAMESMADRVSREKSERYKENLKPLAYGVNFLDDSLIQIARKDLIVIGARTGVGKTEIAKIVAKCNAERGFRVSAFFLEAEENEIERRIKYNLLLERFLDENPGTGDCFGYAEWRLGRYKETLDKFSDEVDEEIKKKYSTLSTYYRVRGDFDIDTLDREVMKVHKNSDLIIIDHLHYIDLDGKDSNKNDEMGKLLKKLRYLTLVLGIPILCIAHLRKGASKNIVPELDDFHGSSEITKIATTCIMLAPCKEFVCSDPDQDISSATFIRVAKFRLDGSRTGYVGVGFYDRNRGMYSQKYSIGRLNFAETKWIPLKAMWPYWSTEANLIKEVQEAG